MLQKLSLFELTIFKLSRNLTALSLTFMTIMTYFCFCFGIEIVLLTLEQIFLNYKLEHYAFFITEYSIYIKMLGTIVLFLPINLSVRNWYFLSKHNSNFDLSQAFIVFSSFRYYFKATVFCFFKSLIIIGFSIVTLVPSAFSIAVFRVMVLTREYSDTITTAVLFISFLLLFIGVVGCGIICIKFMFIDYIFISTIADRYNIKRYFKMFTCV